MTGYIYQIRNIISNKIYIGSTNNVNGRFGNHKRTLNMNKHDNKYLQNAWNKYGEGNFKFEILEIVNESKEDVKDIEQRYLDIIQPYDRTIGYNIAIDTYSGNSGLKLTEEHKLKISKSHIGIRPSEETKKKMSDAKKNYVPWNKGKTLEELVGIEKAKELKKKHNEAISGVNNINYGKKRPEHSLKMCGQSNPMSKTNIQKRKELLYD